MTTELFSKIKNFAFSQKYSLAHGIDHISRVLSHALNIAMDYKVNYDILIAACLLHDIGRSEKYKKESCSHAESGAEVAYDFLTEIGCNNIAQAVSDCIKTHSFRDQKKPLTVEGKILYDADKIDLTGSIGIARALRYSYETDEPLYIINEDGNDELRNDNKPSFINTYDIFIKDAYKKAFTKRGKQIMLQYSKHAKSYYNNLISEITTINKHRNILNNLITNEHKNTLKTA
jgi:uncharacterized protein